MNHRICRSICLNPSLSVGQEKWIIGSYGLDRFVAFDLPLGYCLDSSSGLFN